MKKLDKVNIVSSDKKLQKDIVSLIFTEDNLCRTTDPFLPKYTHDKFSIINHFKAVNGRLTS